MRHASICLGVNVEKIKEKHKSPTLGNQKPDLPQDLQSRGPEEWAAGAYPALGRWQSAPSGLQAPHSGGHRSPEGCGGGNYQPSRHKHSSYCFSSFKSRKHKLKMNHRTHTRLCKRGLDWTFSCFCNESPLGEGQLVTL